MQEMTRKGFLQATVGMGGALRNYPEAKTTLPQTLQSRSDVRGARSCDVVIIGAGLSGLYAARRMRAAGIDVLVLEAQNRVGGRTLTEHLDDKTFIDHGGQWASDGQDGLFALADALGVALFPIWHEGQTVDWYRGSRSTYQGLFPPDDPQAEPQARQAVKALTGMANTLSLETPWTAPNAANWDSQTLDGWIAANLTSARARVAIKRGIEGVFAGGPGQTSLLAALFCLNSAQDLIRHFATAGHGPDRRFVGGAQQLSEKMAAALGERVILNACVSRVEHGSDAVSVAAGELCVRAKRAIITLPPTLAGRLRYTPALPAARDHLTQRTPMGWVIKVHCLYPTRFWRDDSLSGAVTSDEGAMRATADNSPPSGAPGILVGFIEGEQARRLAPVPVAERRAAVLKDFVRYFGAKAADPLLYREKCWGDDEFARGAYGGYWTQGIWTAYGPALRAPIGRLHWAGTETSDVWNGKMEGALRSGERAAAETLAAL
jgi:monoamine oxidase